MTSLAPLRLPSMLARKGFAMTMTSLAPLRLPSMLAHLCLLPRLLAPLLKPPLHRPRSSLTPLPEGPSGRLLLTPLWKGPLHRQLRRILLTC